MMRHTGRLTSNSNGASKRVMEKTLLFLLGASNRLHSETSFILFLRACYWSGNGARPNNFARLIEEEDLGVKKYL